MLTDRQADVLRCVMGGASNKVVARMLAISPGTVKLHMLEIMRRLDVPNRTAAALWAKDNL